MKRRYGRGSSNDGGRDTDKLCWGRNPVFAVLDAAPGSCEKIFLASGTESSFRTRLLEAAGIGGVEVVQTGSSVLDEMTRGEKHQGVVARVLMPQARSLGKRPHRDGTDLLLALDHVKDPHNFGAVIRTAESAGASGVIFPGRRSVGVTGTVVKTSAGAAFRLPLYQVVNLTRSLKELKKDGYWVVGLDHRARSDIWSEPLPERLLLVVGAEGEGLSRLVSERCDDLRRIPMAGQVGSLNAGVAAALGMFEWRRHILAGRKEQPK
ncbi:MAG: 23S rRNA (guanosine(2251)-2'-O)-methyltransferase RlmB [Dethiosulfovibrio peptidovorans]|nr:MAG: 23S rRNA (guanosine(2251)-2'-O)-methyltransferase RlmB [Dethiosulfovibrio peptidovorans]